MVITRHFQTAIFCLCLSFIVSISPAIAQDGPQNFGFEEGESYWTTTSEVTNVSVVGTQGPTTSPTYDELNITVEPDKGSNMLLLGAAKDISENFNVGGNTVSQTFNSHSDAIVLSFWLFSWEHRERDTFSVNVTQTSDPTKTFTVQGMDGSDLSVTMFDGQAPQVCSQTPCVLTPFGNKRGDLVNTGWKRVLISGLPTDGSEITISYSLDGVNDDGHPSWAYLDSANNDPVANFTVSRESTIEGNVSRFIDASTDEDPGDRITRRVWEISYNNASGGTQTKTINDAKEVSIIASNQGTVTAKLKVFDRFGGSDSIQSGESGPGGLAAPTITYANSPIFANKLLTYNVVAGSQGNILTTRYAKPGWDDEITANWSISSGAGTLVQSGANNIQYPVPMMLKGVASIPFDAPDEPGTTVVSLTLSDSDSGTPVTREITINVLAASVFTLSQDDDGNDTPATAVPIVSGTVNVGHLNKRGDVDFFKITDANGNNLPAGSEVFVRVRNAGTDHDLYVVKKLPIEAQGDYEELGLAIEEAGQLFGANSYGFANLFGANSYGFANLFGANAYGFANLFGANSYGFANLFGANSYGFANLFGANSYGFANLFGSNAYGFANLFGSNAYGFANLFGANSYGFANLFGANSYGFANLGDESLNSTQSVVFTTPISSEYTWESAINNGLLHSMWLRDSELDPFAQQSIDKGFGFVQLPLSEAIYLPQSGFVGEKDISLSETSMKDIAATGHYVSFLSVNDGYNDEMALFKNVNAEDIYLAIASEGEFGSAYSIQVEHSVPTKLEHITNGACNGTRLVPSGTADASGIIHTSSNGDDSVMYVVNPQRMSAKYGQERWEDLYSTLQTFVDDFGGKILAINNLEDAVSGTDLYAEMDLYPCQVNKANLVADAIRNTISSHKGQSKSVVVVGDDQQIPFYRVDDLSRMSERDYLPLTPINVSSPLYSAMFHSTILTDKYYASDYSVDNMPVKILIPEWAVSRLVETPEDIISSINEQIANNNKIEMNKAMVSAYDIVFDSGKEIANTLSQALDNDFDNVTEIPFGFDMSPENAWTSTSITCFMLGDDSQIPGCEAKDIASLNGHFTHDILISQSAFENGTDDYLGTKDIDGADGLKISGNYIYTPGCHAGLNIPSPVGILSGSASDVDQQYADFPQSYIRKGATYLAGTGYGIAGVNTNAFSEKLMSLHTKLLVSGGTIGDAVKNSDTVYLLDALNNGLNAYDLKAMYQNVLYGFTETSIGTGIELPADVSDGGCGAESDTRQFTLTVVDGEEITASYEMNKVCTESGQFYEVNGNSTSVVNRPVQPVSNTTYTSGEGSIHGVLIESANYTEDLIDPVFFTPTTDNSTVRTEQSFCQDGRYWPSQLVGYNNNETDSIIQFISGQFVCLNDSEAVGAQRLYTNATVKVLRSTSTDFTKPQINTVDPQISDLGNVVYYVDAIDESGIQEIILTIYLDNSIKTITSGLLSGDGPYAIELSPEDSQLALNNNTSITVIDGASNTAVSSSKGRGMEQVIVTIDESTLFSSISPKTLTATITDYALRKAVAHSMTYVWDFGDGQYETGVVFNKNNNDGDDDFDYINPELIENPDDGTATLTTTHQYTTDENVKVKFKVTDSSGGIGSDELNLQYCGDDVRAPDSPISPDGDLVGCDTTSADTQVTILVQVDGVISPDYQYRLFLDYTNDGQDDLKLVYDNGSITKTRKVDNLTATADGQVLTVSFDLAPTGWTPDIPLHWRMETWSGVKKGKTVGYADAMPETGYFKY